MIIRLPDTIINNLAVGPFMFVYNQGLHLTCHLIFEDECTSTEAARPRHEEASARAPFATAVGFLASVSAQSLSSLPGPQEDVI